MKKQLPAWAALCLVAMVAGLLLGITNAVTQERIAYQAIEAANSARSAVLPEADTFEEEEIESETVDNMYTGYKAGEIVGYTAKVTVKGYGGDIEITVGVDNNGVITGVSIGGANFAETQGLGSRVKDQAFMDQFKDKTAPLVAGENVDTIGGATISSGAAISGVNRGADFILKATGSVESGEETGPLPGATNLTEETPPQGIDKLVKADQGYIATASAQGFGGSVTVTLGVDNEGAITGVIIEALNETPGIGERVATDNGFKEQFIGKTGEQSFGDGLDAVTGATISSDAALKAINTIMAAIG